MAVRRIPLFPLNVVVFPRTALPLHIFEERYKEMVANVIRDRTEFGVVLAKEDGILNAGCTVEVEKIVRMYPDGRMDIRTRGKQRFSIVSLEDDKSWLQADVEFFDDDDLETAADELKSHALEQYRQLRALASSEDLDEPDIADRQLSFQLAQFLPDVNFLSTLLRNRSETTRLKELTRYLAAYLPRRRQTERAKALAPRNGHAQAPPEPER
jgi:Lon protease-like protein